MFVSRWDCFRTILNHFRIGLGSFKSHFGMILGFWTIAEGGREGGSDPFARA